MIHDHVKHLFYRAGFGVSPQVLNAAKEWTRQEAVDFLFDNSKRKDLLKIDFSEFKDVNVMKLRSNKKLQAELAKKSRKRLMDLNVAWFNKMVNTTSDLRERMTLFWANHFVCGDKNVIHAQHYNNILREHALGDFRDMVKAVSKAPAMIKYLNLKQNRKAQPNENFARELMELFTLGNGHYSEGDIKESARAFTGYNHTFSGEFRLRRFQHDYGQKTFFNKTGNFDGDDIIDIILEERECAKFICAKIFRYFVNEVENASHINAMTDVFFKNYNIESLMRFVLMQDWFYDEKNIGSKIKSPIEFLVGLHRTVPFEFKNERSLIRIQKLLGQTLFDPPNVAGWKGHKAWIDTNTIMLRLRLPSLILNGAFIDAEDERSNIRRQYFQKNKIKGVFKTDVDWQSFSKDFKTIPNEELASVVLSPIINRGTESMLRSFSKISKKDHCIQLMSLPEYQMC